MAKEESFKLGDMVEAYSILTGKNELGIIMKPTRAVGKYFVSYYWIYFFMEESEELVYYSFVRTKVA